STEASEWLYGKGNSEILIINNGIDYSKYKFSSEKRIELKRELKLKDKFVLGHVGNFLDVKNHEYLIENIYELNKIKETHLILLGKGPLMNRIVEKTESYGLKDNVLFLGSKINIADYLSAMDVFVFPSKYEGLGLALI